MVFIFCFFFINADAVLFPPWAGIARLSFLVDRLQDAVIPIMDGLVRPVAYTDYIFWVKQSLRVVQHILFCQWVQMVNYNARTDGDSVPDDPICNGMVFAPHVAAVIPNDNSIPEIPPFSRPVKVLIQPSVKPEGVCPHFSVQL